MQIENLGNTLMIDDGAGRSYSIVSDEESITELEEQFRSRGMATLPLPTTTNRADLVESLREIAEEVLENRAATTL